MISCKKDNDLKLVILVFLHGFAEIMKKDYQKDFKSAKESLEKMLEQGLFTQKYINLYIKDLANCEAFILK